MLIQNINSQKQAQIKRITTGFAAVGIATSILSAVFLFTQNVLGPAFANCNSPVVGSYSIASSNIPDSLITTQSSSNGIQSATAPWDNSINSIKYSINRQETYKDKAYTIAQTQFNPSDSQTFLKLESTYTTTSGFYIPRDADFGDGDVQAIFQVHQDSSSKTPPTALYIRGDNIIATIRESDFGDAKIIGTLKIKRDTYQSLKVTYTPSVTGAGFVRYEVDNEVMGEFRGQTMYKGYTNGGYIVNGIADYSNSAKQASLYMDKLSIIETSSCTNKK
jgi:Polysaccharide lyase